MANAPRVAILGVGHMGGAMVRRLRGQRFPVTVWNRTRTTADAIAKSTGAVVRPTAREAAADAEIVVSSLADDAAVKRVYEGVDGAIAGLRAGTVVLETSTIAPQTVRDIEPAIVARGAALLDAPVSGSISLVESGGLTFMLGGDAAAIERARPVLEALSSKLFHVGGRGAGATMKLSVNALVHAINVAVSEALVLAEKAGVDRKVAYDVLAGGVGGAPFVQYKRGAYERPDETPAAFFLDLVVKDLDLILGLADQVGARMDQAATNRATAKAAIAVGLGQRDMSAIAVYLRSLAKA